jgi:hypothetical protein
VRQGILAEASTVAVVDSYISDIHHSTFDSQGFGANYSPGPFKLVNNFISATTENIMFGGGGPGPDNPYVPSDIEIRKNHFFKPLDWAVAGVTIPPHNRWVEKNGIEFKSARRVLVDNNVIENTWRSGQEGYGLLLTVRSSQSGNIAVVDDVTITNNVLKNVQAGFMTMTRDRECGTHYPKCSNQGESKRVKIYNNLVLFRDQTAAGAYNTTKGIMIDDGMSDLVFQHNSIISFDNQACYWSMYFNYANSKVWPPPAPLTHNIWVLDNVLCKQPSGYGLNGTAGLAYYMSDPEPMGPRFWGNVMYAQPGNAQSFPPRNLVTTTPFTFDSNYQLLTPAWRESTDKQHAGYSGPPPEVR